MGGGAKPNLISSFEVHLCLFYVYKYFIACVLVHCMYTGFSGSLEEGVQSSVHACELSCGWWQVNLDSLEE